MPGQGYHLGMTKLIADKIGMEMTEELAVGTLVMDSLNKLAGSRRKSHFCGGAGCRLPEYSELKTTEKIISWDNSYQKSFLVDPEIDMALMEEKNRHIQGEAYMNGIRLHLLADRAYDNLIQNELFDFSEQRANVVKLNRTGEAFSGEDFRKELYKAYPLLDSYLLKAANISFEDIEQTKELLDRTLSKPMSDFLKGYLNFSECKKFEDSYFFDEAIVQSLIESTISDVEKYLSECS